MTVRVQRQCVATEMPLPWCPSLESESDSRKTEREHRRKRRCVKEEETRRTNLNAKQGLQSDQ